MSATILVSGDLAIFFPTFPPAIVVVLPGILSGSASDFHRGRPVCVLGDEKKVMVPGCAYISGPFSIPGVGTLSILRLTTQISLTSSSGGRALLVARGPFIARFSVTTPARIPPPVSTPDPMPLYLGMGEFIPSDVTPTAR